MRKFYQLVFAVLLYVFFAVYLFLLLYVLFFSRISFGGERYIIRSINIIPFKSIWSYLSGRYNVSVNIAFTNLFWNICMFAPLGLYLPVLKSGKKEGAYMGTIFLFSLLTEILQWVLGIGASDIDDIILNCLGALIGLIIYKALLALFKKEQRVRLFVTIISVVAGIPVLYAATATYLYNR